MPRKDLIEFRHGTAEEWATANPVLAEGEPGWDETAGRVKVGDGSTAWNALPYEGVSPVEVYRQAAGLVSENYDLQNAATFLAPVAGTIYSHLLPLLAGQEVTNLCMSTSSTGAAGTAPTLVRMALVDPDGIVVARTGNVGGSAAFLVANTPFEQPLSEPYTVPETGGYRVTHLKVGAWGTTQPSLSRGQLNFDPYSTPLGGGQRKAAVHGTGKTDLPTVGQALDAPTATQAFYWVGCT